MVGGSHRSRKAIKQTTASDRNPVFDLLGLSAIFQFAETQEQAVGCFS